MAFFNLAGSDGHDFALMSFFFRRIGNNDPALRGFLLFQPAYEDAVMQGSDIHSHFFDLHSIHSKTRTITSCDSRPTLRAKNLPIFLPGYFQIIRLFSLAFSFPIRALLLL